MKLLVIRLVVVQSGRLLVPSNNMTVKSLHGLKLLFTKGFSAAWDAAWQLLMHDVSFFKVVIFSNSTADLSSHLEIL